MTEAHSGMITDEKRHNVAGQDLQGTLKEYSRDLTDIHHKALMSHCFCEFMQNNFAGLADGGWVHDGFDPFDGLSELMSDMANRFDVIGEKIDSIELAICSIQSGRCQGSCHPVHWSCC